MEATVEAVMAEAGLLEGFNSTIEFILFSMGLTLVEGIFDGPSTETDLATIAEAAAGGITGAGTLVTGESTLKFGPKLEAEDEPAVEGVVNVVGVVVSVVLRFSSLLVSSSNTLFRDSSLCTIAPCCLAMA